jgi:hypothetical protein
VTLNAQGLVTDEVSYKDDWHFKLINDPEGVSLERLDSRASSQSPDNWHSASSTAGYGTPGYKNSQSQVAGEAVARLTITPKIFSPDNDGRDDIALLHYKMEEAGYVANVTIFNVSGRAVRLLVRNGLLGLEGFWNWDGLDDRGNPLPVGIYIVLTELFNLRGNKNLFKNVIVLARPLK